MLKINHEISVLREEEIVSCKELFNLFWKNDQNILYITDEMGYFIGIITIGDLLEQMRSDIDALPCINRECLKISKNGSLDQEEIKNIFEKNHIATAIPVVDEEGKFCYEIKKRFGKNKNVLTEFKEKIIRYKKSHYLREEIICLQKLLEEQDVVVIGNEERFDLLFGEIVQGKKRIVFLDFCENAYELMSGNKKLFIDLQAAISGGRERIYDVCNNGYSWKRFIDHIIHVIEGGYCSAFYNIIDNEWVTIEDYLEKYMEGGMSFSARGIFIDAFIEYMRKTSFHISEHAGVFRTNSACYEMRINGITAKNRGDDEFTLIRSVNSILQLYKIYNKISTQVKTLNFVFDGIADVTEAEKKRISNGRGELCLYLPDEKNEALDLYSFIEDTDQKYIEGLIKAPRINQKRNFENNLILLEDCASKLVNIENGLRKTCYLPEKYEGTIYFFGKCTVYGLYVEDKYTIPSILQKYIIQSGKKYRVVNLGSECMTNADDLMESLNLSGNDVAIFLFPFITDYIKQNMPVIEIGDRFKELRNDDFGRAECFVEMVQHCGTNGNMIYSKIIFDEVKAYMVDMGEDYIKKNNIYDIFRKEYKDLNVLYDYKNYITELHNKLIEYKVRGNDKIGCIVMNSNPFTKGHRHLVEYAADDVDYLYVFVVEENRSFFSFRDRYEMVKKGTEDLKNVIVVRSGNMIATSTTFPAYYQRKEYQLSKEQPAVNMDLRVFAQYIAPEINIKYRYVGEEPYDLVTKEYNKKMKEILPEFGIDVIEIPRKCMNGEVISASLVREYYKRKDFENLRKWVPNTTAEYLLMHYGLCDNI